MAGTGQTVAVVEDDDSMREAIERLLDAAGFEAAAYTSGEALLAGEGCTGAACVVCDLTLPAMSGLDVLAELRARGVSIPLVLITAHDTPGLREEATRSGAAACLAKPFRGTALLDIVRAVTRAAGTR